MSALVLVAVGLVAGVVSALFGVGGGIVIVPVLMWLEGVDYRIAVGTSLATIVPTALVGVWRKAPVGEVDLRLAALIAVGAVVGAWLGAWLVTAKLPVPLLKRAFAVLLVVVAARMFFES